MNATYLIVWQYDVYEEHEAAFVTAYRSDGDWAQFFESATGYIRTELYRHTHQPLRYYTIDYWESEAHYQRFRESVLDEYRAMDARFDAWTQREMQIGTMNPV